MVAVVVVSLTVAIAIRPFWGLAAICILIPFQLHLIALHPGIRFTAAFLTAFATVLILTVRHAVTKQGLLRRSPLLLPLLCFVLAVLLSFLNSDDVATSYSQFKDVIKFVVVFLAFAVGVRSVKELRRLWVLQLMAAGAVGLLGIIQLVLGPGWTRHLMASDIGLLLNGEWVRQFIVPGGIYGGLAWTTALGVARIPATFFSGDYYASYLGYVIPFGLAFGLYSQNSTHKVCFLTLAALYLVNLAGTLSRGGWLALVVMLLVFAWLEGRRVLAYGLATTAALGAAMFAYPKLVTVLSQRAASIPSQFLENPRWDIWASFTEEIAKHPLIGHGTLEGLRVVTREGRVYSATHAHSLYLMILYAWGAIGLAAFAWLLWRLVGIAWRCYRHSENLNERALSLSLLGALTWFVVHNAVDFQFFHPKNGMAFWFMVASVHCLFVYRRKEVLGSQTVWGGGGALRPSRWAIGTIGVSLAAAIAIVQLCSDALFEGLYIILTALVFGVLLSGILARQATIAPQTTKRKVSI